ncbi:MAG: hypothetical protein BGO55_30325 [Sphingobacteriales bacterium 50-39]|nr:hypothetical protein [Sphingobacteriales bacterium]OJW60819.1 MAG: hypothetical protein BGO55_30325 [Sphingobacteriales bacterium 50-39]
MKRKAKGRKLVTMVCAIVLFKLVAAQEKDKDKMVGMYIHQAWAYNHPYAARTWTLQDWRSYLGGICQIGYNSILIWPMLETMPNPLTPSDQAELGKTKSIIEVAQKEFKMKVFIVLCPNIAPKSEKASRYTFKDRPLYGMDEYVDSGDPVKLGKLMEWREKLFRPLKQADGVFIIDSDPGGYPNSTNVEFAYLLTAHKRMLNRLRPGIEIYYWAWTGWESYGKFHATGHFTMGTQAEIQDALGLIQRQGIEPWGVASNWASFGQGIDSVMKDRLLAFNYGAIEAEPAFPFTGYGDAAYNAGKLSGSRGVFANALTHAIQLPNTFAFARGAMGLSAETADYVAFANQLIEDAGDEIEESWKALQTTDVSRMEAAVAELSKLQKSTLKTGRLGGLLFNDPRRFIADLISELHMAASLYTLTQTLKSENGKATPRSIGEFGAFINAADDWHKRHGYNSFWYWPPMTEALKAFPSNYLHPFLTGEPWWELGKGETLTERVADAYVQVQTYTPRLISAMKATLKDLNRQKTFKQNFQTLAVYLHPSWHMETKRDYDFWKACGYNTISFLITGVTVSDAILDPYYSRMVNAQQAGFKVEIVVLSNIGGNGHGFDPRDTGQMRKRLNDIESIIKRLSITDVITLVAGDPGGSPVALGEAGVGYFLEMALKVRDMARMHAANAQYNVNLWALAYWDSEATSPFTVDFWDKETLYSRMMIADPAVKDMGIEFPMHNYYRSLALDMYSKANKAPDLFPNNNDIRSLAPSGKNQLLAWPYFLVDEVDDGYTGYLASGIHPTQSETRYLNSLIDSARKLGLNGVVVNVGIDSSDIETEVLNIYATGRFCQDSLLRPEEVIDEFASLIADKGTAPVLGKILRFVENHSTWEASLPQAYRLHPFVVDYPNANQALNALAGVRPITKQKFPLPITPGEFLRRVKIRLLEIH